MKFFSCNQGENQPSIEGADFIIGLPSYGNVGLMALDVLISTIRKGAANQLELIGYGETEFLLPMGGYDSFGSSERILLHPLEFYRVKGTSTVLIMIRSICREIEERLFATEIVELVKDLNYSSVLFLTGAIPDDWDLNTMLQKSRCFTFRKQNDSTSNFQTLFDITFNIEERVSTPINQSTQEFPFGMEIAVTAFRSLNERVAILGQFSLGAVQPLDGTILVIPELLFTHARYFSNLFSHPLSMTDFHIPLSWKLMQESHQPADLFPVW